MTAGKTKRVAHTTTLRQLDGSLTTDLQGTLSLIIQKFAPEDNQEDDTDNHRQARNLISMPMDTDDDAEFTEQEVTNVIYDMGNKKAPGDAQRSTEGVSENSTKVYNGDIQQMSQGGSFS